MSCIWAIGDDLNVMPVSVQLQVDVTLYGSAEQESQFENEGARDADGSYVSHRVDSNPVNTYHYDKAYQDLWRIDLSSHHDVLQSAFPAVIEPIDVVLRRPNR